MLREEDKTFVELAVMYKDEGNEWIKKNSAHDWNEAIIRYNHALGFLDKADSARIDGIEDEKDKLIQLNELRSQIINNRAQASMNKKNYGTALKDVELVEFKIRTILI